MTEDNSIKMAYAPEVDKSVMVIGIQADGCFHKIGPLDYTELKSLTTRLSDIQSSMEYELGIGGSK